MKPRKQQRVMDMKQSPMNALRYRLLLDCWHEVWITAKRRPRRRFMRCPVCSRIAACGGEGV